MRVFLFLFCCIFSMNLFSETRFSLNIGHSKSINSIDIDKNSKYIYSVSDDGKLLIHDIENQRVFNQIQLSSVQIKKIIKHPTKDIIALYETNNLNKYQINVWDLKQNKKLYSHNLSEAPLYFGFSPKGTYLLYTTANWNSISFIEAETGDISPIIENGFGIVPSLFVSSSEKTIVAYGPSGKIFYIDMKTGLQKSDDPISTINDLKNVLFHDKGRFFLGTKNDSVYLIDMVNGNVLDRITLGEIQSIALYGNDITVHLKKGNYYNLKKLTISNSELLQGISNDRNIPVAPSIIMTEKYVLLPGISGRLYVYDIKDLHPVQYDIREPIPISNVQYRDGTLYALYNNNVVKFNNSFTSISKVFENNEVEGFYIKDDIFLFWNSDRSIFQYDILTKDISDFLSLTDSVKSISSSMNTVAILENNGTLHVVKIQEENIYRRYPTKGLNTIVMPNPSTILGGRNVGGSFNTSLVQISSDTGETIGIENKNKMIVNMTVDPVTSTIYTLGVQDRRGTQYTVISDITDSTFTISNPMAAFKGIDNTITYAVDPYSSKFFTSTGSEGLQMYSWDGFTKLEKSLHITDNFSISEEYLISVNSDFSLSFWDKTSGDFLFDAYILDLNEVLLTMKDGTYYSNNRNTSTIQYFDSRGRVISDTREFFNKLQF